MQRRARVDSAQSWQNFRRALVELRGWGLVHVKTDIVHLRGSIVDLQPLNLPELCCRPLWLNSDGDVPHYLKGEPFHEVPWDASDSVASEYPPHLVLAAGPGRSALQRLRSLHQHCIERNVALRSYCSLSTPNMEWTVLLIPATYPPQPSASEHEAAAAAGPSHAAPAASAVAPCFHAYFLPWDGHGGTAVQPPGGQQRDAADAGEDSDGDDGDDEERLTGRTDANADALCSLNDTWLRRRLGSRAAQRGKDDPDVARWRRERRCLDADPATGLPRTEAGAVHFSGYWDRTRSSYGAGCSGRLGGSYSGCFSSFNSGGGGVRRLLGGPLSHVSCVQSVMPGARFTYSTRPWRSHGPGGRLEPMEEEQQEGFLRPCGCEAAGVLCGGLRARKALHAMRNGGSPFCLEIRPTPGGGEGQRGLGVFALEPIPEGAYVMEYVGVHMTKKEASELEGGRRRAGAEEERAAGASCAAGPPTAPGGYEAFGLHYTFDSEHVSKLSRKDRRGALRVVDATHLGNAARFVNHHCDANLACVNVCAGRQGDTLMLLALRATRDIRPGEELSLNYYGLLGEPQKEYVRAHSSGPVPCRCGAASCLRWLFVPLPDRGPLQLGGPAATATATVTATATGCTTTTTAEATLSASMGPGELEGEESLSFQPSEECGAAARRRAAGKAAAAAAALAGRKADADPSSHKDLRRRRRHEFASTGTSRRQALRTGPFGLPSGRGAQGGGRGDRLLPPDQDEQEERRYRRRRAKAAKLRSAAGAGAGGAAGAAATLPGALTVETVRHGPAAPAPADAPAVEHRRAEALAVDTAEAVADAVAAIATGATGLLTAVSGAAMAVAGAVDSVMGMAANGLAGGVRSSGSLPATSGPSRGGGDGGGGGAVRLDAGGASRKRAISTEGRPEDAAKRQWAERVA